MAILSTVGGFTNIGHDLQVSIAVAGGDIVAAGPLFIPNIMSVEWRQTTTDLVHMQMNGPTLYATLPKGYEGSIEYHRAGGDIEALVSAIHESWLSGEDPITATIVCNVIGVDPNTFTFTGAALALEEGGQWRGDEVTHCRIRFQASRMLA